MDQDIDHCFIDAVKKMSVHLQHLVMSGKNKSFVAGEILRHLEVRCSFLSRSCATRSLPARIDLTRQPPPLQIEGRVCENIGEKMMLEELGLDLGHGNWDALLAAARHLPRLQGLYINLDESMCPEDVETLSKAAPELRHLLLGASQWRSSWVRPAFSLPLLPLTLSRPSLALFRPEGSR